VEVAIAAGELLEFAFIPPGSFQMGSGNEHFSEAPVHTVTFAAGFYLGMYPVTRSQWSAVMGDDPSCFRSTHDAPVESVSWNMAVEFCARLRHQTGRSVRLPSESEWEYACRAGEGGDFHFIADSPFADESDVPWRIREALCDYAWIDLNSEESTHSVGLKKPNAWGLHDMLGNVWEWCADVWHPNYTAAPSDGAVWDEGGDAQPRRCLRGALGT
jgi:formylglycine-generating enzyme required for sulfatase activity